MDSIKRFVERNQKVIADVCKNSEENKRFAEAMKRDYGIDIWDEEKFPVSNESFSFKKMRESLSKRMKEADVSSSFPQLLRAGVLALGAKGYQMQETTFEQWVKVVPSKRDTELYAPSHGVSFPNQVAQGQIYPEVGAATLNLSLKNYKYGAIYAATKEMVNDDQTGQIIEGATQLGAYLKILTEVLCYGKLASVSNMQYADYKIPVSETKPDGVTTYPWATAAQAFPGGGYTRPDTYAAPGVSTFNDARVALLNQKNLQGLKMGIQGDTIIHGPKIAVEVATLLNSQFYPINSTVGAVGGLGSINPIKGLFTPIESPFVFKNDGTVNGDSKAWYVTSRKIQGAAFVMQLRDAVMLEQENPSSGKSFEQDIIRYKGSMRGNADFVEARYFWQGNNGSV
jgi:hypothetical protein